MSTLNGILTTQDDEDEEEVHAEKDDADKIHAEDASASQPPSPKTIKIQELSIQLLLLQTLNQKLVKEKDAAETEAALLKAKPSFLNVEHLTELLIMVSLDILDYRVTLGFGSTGGLDLACPIIRLSCQYGIHQRGVNNLHSSWDDLGFTILYYPRSGSLPVSALSDMEDDVDISALIMEQYIALILDDIKPGIVNPKIGNDLEFEINANFMRE
ncbi:hypothetical protein Tco_1398106 [Tanacetum coccineum]